MLSTILKTAPRCLSVGKGTVTSQWTNRIVQRLASFTTRELLNERSDETGTLLTRFAKHIAIERHASAAVVPTTIRYSDYFPVTDLRYFQNELRRTPALQLPSLIIFASTYRSNADPPKFVSILNDLDAAAMAKLEVMDEDTVLQTLYAFLFLIPNWITRTDFYPAAVKRLAEKDFTTATPKDKFVQLCFYLGMDKKRQGTEPILQRLLGSHMERYLPALSTMDLAIICNAAYKTSTTVESSAYNKRLEEEVEKLPLDSVNDALLVTFVKAMRFQRVRSERFCERLAELCGTTRGLNHLQARGLVHLFAYFAENLWDNSKCIDAIIKEFMRNTKRNDQFRSYAETLRGKDIATFLWSCAHLNCSIGQMDLERLETILLNMVRNNEFRNFPDQLVDSCLSLWSLGYKSRELLQETINLKTQLRPNAPKQQREQPKVDSRFTLLLSAVGIEEPNWLPNTMRAAHRFNLEKPVPAYLLKDRSDLTTYAERVALEDGIADVKLVCPINALNIPGLQVQFSTSESAKVLVELLTKEQILRFSGEPISLIRLKRRLQIALGHKVIVIRPSDLQETYTSLKDLSQDTSDELIDLQRNKLSVGSI